jgi:hypothetical protein
MPGYTHQLFGQRAVKYANKAINRRRFYVRSLRTNYTKIKDKVGVSL